MRRPVTLTLAVALIAALAAVAILGLREQLHRGVQRATLISVSLPSTRSVASAAIDPCRNLSAQATRTLPALALVHGGALTAVDFRTCRARTLIRAGARTPVRVSADGRWIGEGAAVVVARDGGSVQRPLGHDVLAIPARSTWAWGPRGDVLAGATTSGAVVVGRPGGRPRQLTSAHWGLVTDVTFTDADTLVVVRNENQLWQIPVRGGPARLLYRDPVATASLRIALVHDGAVIVWRQRIASASAAADGATLERVALSDGRVDRMAAAVLIQPGSVVPCGPGTAVVAGGGRNATVDKHVEIFSRRWVSRIIGAGVSPSCSADGHSVAWVRGPAHSEIGIGNERRQLVVARAGARPLAITSRPSVGPGSEDPILATNGDQVLWMQAPPETRPAATVSPPATMMVAPTSSRLPEGTETTLSGRAIDYYGSFGWPLALAVIPSG